MSSHGSVNDAENNNNGNNADNGGKAVTRAEFNQLQENITVIMERLEVRERRSHGSASHRGSHHRSDGSHRRRSSDESDATSGRNRRHDGRQLKI